MHLLPTHDEVVRVLRDTGALRDGHFVYPDGLHSNEYLQVPLAMRYGKRGRTLGIALAILSFFVYFLMISAFSAFGRNGQINPVLAAWLPNIIMATAAVVLFWLEER